MDRRVVTSSLVPYSTGGGHIYCPELSYLAHPTEEKTEKKWAQEEKGLMKYNVSVITQEGGRKPIQVSQN